jgi:PAS domain S-box-containing protein
MNSVPFNKNRRVLVVDDNRAIHDDFRKILSPATATVVALDATEKALFGHSKDAIPQTQFEVDSAYQGQEGVLLVKKALEAGLPYAMAFVDVRMPPGWDGVETTRKIWELDPDLQIVLCTAYSDYSWDEMFEKLGHHDGLLILKKPFDVVEAFQLAHALTEKWWLHQQSVRKMEELESRVAERTRELQQTNHALQTEVAEHKRAEETLRESEEKFRQLADNITDVFWITSPDLKTMYYISAGYEVIWGRSTESLYARPHQWIEVILPEDRERVVAVFGTLMGNEPKVSVEYRIARPDGTVRWVHDRGFQIRDSAGKVIRLTGIVTDITERKKNEAALQRSEAHTRAIVQSSLDCIVTIDHEGKILEFNPAAEIVFGYPRAKVLGKKLAEVVIPPSLRERHRQGMARYLATGEAKVLGKRIEIVAMRSDGSEFPVELAITRLGAEEPLMFTGFIRDITERKRGEEALRQAEEKYRGIFENALEGIFQTTPDGRFIAANRALARLLGFDSPEELIAARTDIAQENYVDPKSREEFKRLLDENGSVLDFELEAYRKDRTRIWLSENVHAVRNEKGTIVYYEGTAEDITKRKRAEDALRTSEAHLQTVVENLDEGVIVSDLNGELLHWNRAALEIHGIANLEEGRRGPTELVDTFELSAMDGTLVPVEEWPLSRILRGENLHDFELGVRNIKAGWQRIFNYGGTLVRDGNNQPLLAIITITDITERKGGEEMLRASEERYRSLFESNPNPMWVYDVETLLFLAVNAAAVEHYGYSQDEFLAMTIKDIRPAEDIPALIDDLVETTGVAKNAIQWRHCRKDKTMIEVEIASHDLIWLGRRARLVLINDITERNRAEARVREQADIINRAHDAITVVNFEDQHITFWNSGAERLYGWSADEAIGKSIGELIFANEKEREAPLKALMSTGEFHGEIKQVAKDGREIIVDTRATLIRNPAGEPLSVLLINTDVTDQKKLETQLLRAQRLESIGTLASGVAHDLNNILAPILMCAQTLRDNLDAEDRQSAISLIEDSAQRGASVVKQVLTFARGIEGERVLIQPTHLIEEMIDIARQTFPKSIELTGRYPEDLWTIQGDPTQLHQVLLNLSVNARDAMPNGGSLTLAAENFTIDENYAAMTPDAKVGPYVILRVTDSGTGMPRATADKIFDPFFTTKEIGKGTGLGLSTVLGIVKSHGGFISVYSEIGQGTTFKIFFPATMSDEDLKKSRTAAAPMQGNGEQILVVDDEPNILRITKMIFERHNYRVVSASDGTEALALFAQQMDSIGGVLTDISMPYMDGVALVRALRKMKSDIPIIASTGQGDEPGLAVLQSLGVKNFLTKPYNAQTLLTTLRDTLSGTPGNPVERLQSRS